MLIASAVMLATVVAGCGGDNDGDDKPFTSDPETAVRRIVARLDYVAADYGGAVVDGQIANAQEYDEQVGFLADARLRVQSLPPSKAAAALSLTLDHAVALVAARASQAEVTEVCRQVRQELLRITGVTLAPSTPPSAADGEAVFLDKCARCHGSTGAGDGPSAHGLYPPPRSFRDPEVMAQLAPIRAFSAVTDGVAGTAMVRFAELDEHERWSVAFHVVSLRHDAAATERGKVVAGRLPRPSTSLSGLTNATDAELTRALSATGVDGNALSDALAYLRHEAPYVSAASLEQVRTMLRDTRDAYLRGNTALARDLASDAYLNGFEPVEGRLAVGASDLVHRTEERFLALRQGIDSRESTAAIGQTIDELGLLLEAADARLEGDASGWSTALTVLVIILREGIESVLLLMLLLGMTKRDGMPADRRAIHTGWTLALLAGLVTWFASAAVVSMGGGNRELIEGVIALVAVVVLIYSGHFVLARLDAKRRVTVLKRRFGALSPQRRRLVLAGLAFLALYREAFEVVLFLRAVILANPDSSLPFIGGLIAGVAGIAIFAVVAARLGRRLKPSAMLTIGGALLCVLAVVLAGKGIRSLQEAGVLGISTVDGPRVDVLGIFPTGETLVTQAVVVVVLVVISIVALRRSRRLAKAAIDGAAVTPVESH